MEMKKVWARQKVDKNRACLRNGKDVWRDQNMVGPASEQQEMVLERGPRPRALRSWMQELLNAWALLFWLHNPHQGVWPEKNTTVSWEMISTVVRQLDWRKESWGVMAELGQCVQRRVPASRDSHSAHTISRFVDLCVNGRAQVFIQCPIHPIPTTSHKANLKMNFSMQKGKHTTFDS